MYAALSALVALSATVSSASAAIGSAGDDKVTSLPNAPPLPSNHYSGYLTASSSKNIHYYLVQSDRAKYDVMMFNHYFYMAWTTCCTPLMIGFLYSHWAALPLETIVLGISVLAFTVPMQLYATYKFRVIALSTHKRMQEATKAATEVDGAVSIAAGRNSPLLAGK